MFVLFYRDLHVYIFGKEMRAEQEVENIERYNQKGRDLKVHRQEWYKQQEAGICLKKRRYSSSSENRGGGVRVCISYCT